MMMLPEDRAALYTLLTFAALIAICALVVSCVPAHATRGCLERGGCAAVLRHGWQRVPPPLPVYKTPEEATTARYMLERWPIEPIYRLRGE